MRILVFGGSFDPVHRGHLALLAAAARELRPDRIVLVPAGRPPHKPGPVASFEERVALLKSALRSPAAKRLAAKTVIERFEGKGRGPHYTVGTLQHLRRRWPRAEFFLLLGSDQLAEFSGWRRPDEIRRLAQLVFGSRRGGPSARRDGARKLKGSFPPVSSSDIRRLLAEGETASASLSPEVAREIRRRGLYGAGLVAWLRGNVGSGRLRHILGVTRTAGALAAAHGLDVWKARQAALLHDAGRAFTREEMVRYARKNRLAVPRRSDIEAHEPMLLHAFISADLARKRFGVSDPEVLGAIARHTLGGGSLKPLETLLYVADAGSEDRAFKQARRIRTLGEKDLMEALHLAARTKLAWVRAKGRWEHPLGEATLRFAERKMKDKR